MSHPLELSAARALAALSVALGEGAFAPGDVLGVVAEFEGCAEDRLGGFVRTGRAGGHADTSLRDALPGSAHRMVRTALHQVRADGAMAGAPGFHSLILDLPRGDFTLRLHDMRLFKLDAARGVAVDAPGLAAG